MSSGANRLPARFIESALPSRAEYDASLLLGDAERRGLEAAARAKQVRDGVGFRVVSRDRQSTESSDATVSEDDAADTSVAYARMASQHWLSSGRERGKRLSDTRRNIVIRPTGTKPFANSAEDALKQITAAFGPALSSSPSRSTGAAAGSKTSVLATAAATDSPTSFRTKRLTEVLAKIQAGGASDLEDDLDVSSPDSPQHEQRQKPYEYRRRRPPLGGSCLSVLALASDA